MPSRSDGWSQVQQLLPLGWEQKAHEFGAFQRSRYLRRPETLLRMLLFHVVSATGLRLSVQSLRSAGIAAVGAKSLWKRFRTAAPWLRWICTELCHSAWACPRLPPGRRLRVADSTLIQRPGVKGSDFRMHYTLDLSSLTCDWFRLTDVHFGERVTRIPLAAGDILITDRNYFSAPAAKYATRHRAALIARLRWKHPAMEDDTGRPFSALHRARPLRVNEHKEWEVDLCDHGPSGRVISLRLPTLKYLETKEKLRRRAARKGVKTQPETYAAAHLVMLFTTVPEDLLTGAEVLEIYRFRWQVEIAFRLFKQLLRIGRIPHKDHAVAEGWILAKLIIILLIEKVRRSLFLPTEVSQTFETDPEPNLWRWTALALKVLEPILCPPMTWEEFLNGSEEQALGLHEEGQQEEQLQRLGKILQRWFI